jgi:hypothetical protein
VYVLLLSHTKYNTRTSSCLIHILYLFIYIVLLYLEKVWKMNVETENIK